MTFATATLTRKRTYATVEVEVEVDLSDLADNGWHSEEDCARRPLQSREIVSDAIGSLHRQAHPSQPLNVQLCREEPCRSLTDFGGDA